MTPRLHRQIWEFLFSPFTHEQKIDWLLIAVFIGINCLIFLNVFIHDPRIGYDSEDHLKYIDVLSNGRLASEEETSEFFSPPLPYAVGAFTQAKLSISTFKAARGSQVVNGFLSMGLLLLLLKTCQLISFRPSLKLGSLVALGCLPVYYKSFTFVRGEPFVAFFSVLVLYLTAILLLKKEWELIQFLLLGIALGLCALSRQWGFFLFPAVGLMLTWEYFRNPSRRRLILRGVFVSFLTAGLIAGWFYASLFFRYGSATAFNRSPDQKFSFSNQPLSFYFGISPQLLFSQPVRPNFANQFWPILYSDTWGDYWGYFSVYGKDMRTSSYISGMKLSENLMVGKQAGWLETNYDTFSAYLGRTMIVSLYPSLLAVCSIFFTLSLFFNRLSIGSSSQKKVSAFLFLAIAATLVGYGWFLIQYPNDRGDTIKATYLLHVYPYLAMLVGGWLSWIESKNRYLYIFLLGGLGVVIIHNLPAMLSHYPLY